MPKIKGQTKRPQYKTAIKKASVHHHHKAKGTKTAVTVQKAAHKAAAKLRDSFKTGDVNKFKKLEGLLQAARKKGEKLLKSNEFVKLFSPDRQAALKTARGLVDRAKTEAKKMVNKKLSGWDGSLASASKKTSSGKGNAWVSGGISGAQQGKPHDMKIKDSRSGGREYAVAKKTQDRLSSAGGKLSQAGAKLQQLDAAAKKLGIDTTIAKGEAKTGGSKVLAQTKDGKGKVTLDTSASGSYQVGLSGASAQGQAGVGVTASYGDSAKTTGKYGTAEASYKAQASAKASADGKVSLSANGLEATANAYVGVSASVEGTAKVESKPLVKIGGVDVKANASVTGKVEAGAYAYANATAKVTGNPPTAVVQAKAGAFAGAKATATGKVGVGPFSASVTGEAWAGAGAEAHVEAGYKNGKLSLSWGAGAAVGYGAGLSGKVEVDVKQLGKMAEGVVDQVGDAAKKALDTDGDGKLTLNDAKVAGQKIERAVEKTVDRATRTVRDAASSAAKAAGSAAKAVVNTAGKAVERAGSAIKSFGKKLASWSPW